MRIFPSPKQMQLGGQSCPALEPGAAAPWSPEDWAARVPGLHIDTRARLPLPDDLRPELRSEAYQVAIDDGGIRILAEAREGALRASATLRQLLGPDGALPHCTVLDWPDFRYRCAADWLMNCEINRWACDWGDGPQAFLGRVRRKLDFCFDHKISQVWFDGFGWDLRRFAGYADLMRECNRYARERGIRLVHAGYGGGYGTSYQASELYRCGYQGQVFHNRRPWPDGPTYDCIGCDVPESRSLGTCASNHEWQDAKIANLREFVAAVEPGFVYIHDIDAGSFEASREGWLWRCDECRRRWPSDEMTDPEGQAGAYAAWFRRVAEGLRSVSSHAGYDAAADLTIGFVSPVYTLHEEPGQPELWDQEVEYFRLLSTLIGPQPDIVFGVREQFYRADGSAKVGYLQQALDEVGHGHGVQVIAFAGGDNYTSDDLCNVSGGFARLYRGARSVCISNGGAHQEPIQVLNAEFLWNSAADGFAIDPGSNEAIDRVLAQVRLGRWRPEAICGAGRTLQQACEHLWGAEAGELMYRARSCGGDSGEGPISHVWWSVTREIGRLTGERPPWNDPASFEDLAARWGRRAEVTQEALRHARQAAWLTADEDVHWFARCLETGGHFAGVLTAAYDWRANASEGAREEALSRLAALREHLAREPAPIRTDVLGGEPGCWEETAEALARVLGAGA